MRLRAQAQEAAAPAGHWRGRACTICASAKGSRVHAWRLDAAGHDPEALTLLRKPQALVDQVRAEAAAALRERLRRLQDVEARARAALLPAVPGPGPEGFSGPGDPAPAEPAPVAPGQAPAQAGAAAAAPAAAAEHLRGSSAAHNKAVHEAGSLGGGPRLDTEGAPVGSPPAAALAAILTPAGGNWAGSPGRSGTPPQVTELLQPCLWPTSAQRF